MAVPTLLTSGGREGPMVRTAGGGGGGGGGGRGGSADEPLGALS
jgi:hypothetical protein